MVTMYFPIDWIQQGADPAWLVVPVRLKGVLLLKERETMPLLPALLVSFLSLLESRSVRCIVSLVRRGWFFVISVFAANLQRRAANAVSDLPRRRRLR